MTQSRLSPDNERALEELAELIRVRPPLVAFTGAGISTESGIPDYRGPSGLWTTGAAKPVTYDKFMASVETRLAWWRALPERVAQARDRMPNAGHVALARIERAGILAATITQNIDGLHVDAGSSPERVIELHGSTRAIRCVDCGLLFPVEDFIDLIPSLVEPPSCPNCGGILKSATIAFGQPMPRRETQLAIAIARQSGVMLVVGSTLLVYPAAQTPAVARESGAALAILNIGETALDDLADIRVEAPAGLALTYLADQLLSER